ncbi:hypothetical protein [Ovoidimarina sediminis]|uniref:hypothetical protein n=1 Tax=Ovoidimarina sediminis TaxID=3079856 RepID=UPI0029159BF7|nr:hypothetical protein [Rhodophyticola sp. MJ-SS7]MDU8944447.1 hypothetical protein [Rhodophyticola sp. MJ-SS7]
MTEMVQAEQLLTPMSGPKRRKPARRLPSLAPADRKHEDAPETGLARFGIRLSQGAIQDEPTDFRERAESYDMVARLTVYTLNATVLVLAFPVGFGLLIFNILGGENLRTTAHTLALTGLGTALGAAGVMADLLGLI